jgi:glycosyltransferase involved in cell wall biosynthesis
VIGSNLGGIAELVKHQLDGLLVKPESHAQWTRTLQELADHPEAVDRLRSGVRPPRKMAAVADEMAALYLDIMSRQATAASSVASATCTGGF